MQRFSISFQRVGYVSMAATLVATGLGALAKQAYGAQVSDASLGNTTIYEPVVSPVLELGEMEVGPTPTNPVVVPAEVGYTPSDQNDPRQTRPISMLMSNQDVIDACQSIGRVYNPDTGMCGGSNVRS